MARYGYDALGRRTRKTVTWGDNGKQEETRFLWEGFRLLQARQANRTETYLYDPTIWWSPLARITQQPGAPDGDIRWFNTELNGAPLEMTDAEGAVRWSGDYGSFGAVNGQTQDSEGLRHGKPVESQSLRYAGQYADEETGLHYNLFRYYDPTIGRFTTQDPIGLAGGINLYQYAPNPLGWVDPLGLAKCGSGEWKSRRTFKDGDSGLKDHARRHSNLSPEKYLERGKRNISDGSLLKGGGRSPSDNYYVRKLGDNDYSVTITDKNNKILSIDTWKEGGLPMTKDKVIKGLSRSGITPQEGFWEML